MATTSGRQSPRVVALPIGAWVLVLVVMAFIHRFVPGSTWLMVHGATLGIVTTAIVYFSDHFARALLKMGPLSHSGLYARLAMVNGATVVTAIAIMVELPWLAVAGAVVVGLALWWHAFALVQMIRSSLARRFTAMIGTYVVACCWLPVGVACGALLAFGPAEPWKGQLLAAHQASNLLGFVGMTVIASWVTLWPMVLRTKILDGTERVVRWCVLVMTAGVAGVVVNALAGFTRLGGVFAALCALTLIALSVTFGRMALKKPPREVSSLSMAAAWLWGIAGTTWFAVSLLRGKSSAATLQDVTPLWVAGFLLQMILGALSYLFPMLRGGGPANARRGHRIMNWGGGWRLALYNVGVLVFVTSSTSWVKVATSLAIFAAMVAFVVLCVIIVVRRPLPTNVGLTINRGGPPPQPVESPTAMPRRSLVGAAIATGAILGIGAFGWATKGGRGGPASGNETVIDIRAEGMKFIPNRVDVAPGTAVRLRVTNTDSSNVHDLQMANGAETGRLKPGEVGDVSLGVVNEPTEGWCTILGHRAMGMTLTVGVTGHAGHGNHAATGGAAALARRVVDLEPAPGTDYRIRDAVLPPVTPGTLALTLTAGDIVVEVAPNVTQKAMTFNERVMGPVIRASLGQRVQVRLINNGIMGHSVDFHAGTVSPDNVMRTIAPGAALDYPFVAKRSGIWLYHCSTHPMSAHISGGMFGALIVTPPGAAKVDREYVIVQSEAYLAADNGADVNMDKIIETKHDLQLFNGHANQYVHAPLTAKVGERVRFWVLVAGPSQPTSFHIVGTQFDTVFKEGAYLLRPAGAEGGGAQALDLAAAQGGFVEMVFEEPGTYTFVNHVMVEAERGARGLIRVTA